MERLIKAALFDLDGVLVRTDKYHFQAWLRLAEEQGWLFNEEINDHCRAIPRMASLELILEHNGLSLSEDKKLALATKKNSYYLELLDSLSEDSLIPGARDFLRALKEEKVLLAICSSSENAPLILKRLGMLDYFTASVIGREVCRQRPDPQIFLLAAEKLDVAPGNCIVFEDAQAGVAAAKKAGMSCIGVGERSQLPEAPETITDFNSLNLAELLERGRLFKK